FAAPLLFLAVVEALIHTHMDFKSGARMIGISLFNGCLALALGLTLSNWLRPGEHLSLPADAAASGSGALPEVGKGGIDFFKALAGYVPTSVIQPFVDNAIISIIILALFAGL